MGMASLLLSFSRPRSPNRCLLLRDPDQYHAVFAFLRRRFQIRASHFLLILALLEMYDGNMASLGKPIDRFHILLANLAESSRRRTLDLPFPTHEPPYQSDRLQLHHA